MTSEESGSAPEAGTELPPGVVFHLVEDDPAKQRGVLTNVVNLLDELADSSPVELVVNGPGLSGVLSESSVALPLAELLGRGVTVVACANSMRARGVSDEDLIEGVSVVPAGVAELVRRQRAGWAYLRP